MEINPFSKQEQLVSKGHISYEYDIYVPIKKIKNQDSSRVLILMSDAEDDTILYNKVKQPKFGSKTKSNPKIFQSLFEDTGKHDNNSEFSSGSKSQLAPSDRISKKKRACDQPITLDTHFDTPIDESLPTVVRKNKFSIRASRKKLMNEMNVFADVFNESSEETLHSHNISNSNTKCSSRDQEIGQLSDISTLDPEPRIICQKPEILNFKKPLNKKFNILKKYSRNEIYKFTDQFNNSSEYSNNENITHVHLDEKSNTANSCEEKFRRNAFKIRKSRSFKISNASSPKLLEGSTVKIDNEIDSDPKANALSLKSRMKKLHQNKLEQELFQNIFHVAEKSESGEITDINCNCEQGSSNISVPENMFLKEKYYQIQSKAFDFPVLKDDLLRKNSSHTERNTNNEKHMENSLAVKDNHIKDSQQNKIEVHLSALAIQDTSGDELGVINGKSVTVSKSKNRFSASEKPVERNNELGNKRTVSRISNEVHESSINKKPELQTYINKVTVKETDKMGSQFFRDRERNYSSKLAQANCDKLEKLRQTPLDNYVSHKNKCQEYSSKLNSNVDEFIGLNQGKHKSKSTPFANTHIGKDLNKPQSCVIEIAVNSSRYQNGDEIVGTEVSSNKDSPMKEQSQMDSSQILNASSSDLTFDPDTVPHSTLLNTPVLCTPKKKHVSEMNLYKLKEASYDLIYNLDTENDKQLSYKSTSKKKNNRYLKILSDKQETNIVNQSHQKFLGQGSNIVNRNQEESLLKLDKVQSTSNQKHVNLSHDKSYNILSSRKTESRTKKYSVNNNVRPVKMNNVDLVLTADISHNNDHICCSESLHEVYNANEEVFPNNVTHSVKKQNVDEFGENCQSAVTTEHSNSDHSPRNESVATALVINHVKSNAHISHNSCQIIRNKNPQVALETIQVSSDNITDSRKKLKEMELNESSYNSAQKTETVTRSEEHYSHQNSSRNKSERPVLINNANIEQDPQEIQYENIKVSSDRNIHSELNSKEMELRKSSHISLQKPRSFTPTSVVNHSGMTFPKTLEPENRMMVNMDSNSNKLFESVIFNDSDHNMFKMENLVRKTDMAKVKSPSAFHQDHPSAPLNKKQNSKKKIQSRKFSDKGTLRLAKPVGWVNNRFYNRLLPHFEAKFGPMLYASKCENMVIELCQNIKEAVKNSTQQEKCVKCIRKLLYDAGIIISPMDFIEFTEEYLPNEFNFIAIPKNIGFCKVGVAFPDGIGMFEDMKL